MSVTDEAALLPRAGGGSDDDSLKTLLRRLPRRLKAQVVVEMLESAKPGAIRPPCPAALSRIARHNGVNEARLLRAVLAEFLTQSRSKGQMLPRQPAKPEAPKAPAISSPGDRARQGGKDGAAGALPASLLCEHPRVAAARLRDTPTESAGRWLRAAPPPLARATALALSGMERRAPARPVPATPGRRGAG